MHYLYDKETGETASQRTEAAAAQSRYRRPASKRIFPADHVSPVPRSIFGDHAQRVLHNHVTGYRVRKDGSGESPSPSSIREFLRRRYSESTRWIFCSAYDEPKVHASSTDLEDLVVPSEQGPLLFTVALFPHPYTECHMKSNRINTAIMPATQPVVANPMRLLSTDLGEVLIKLYFLMALLELSPDN